MDWFDDLSRTFFDFSAMAEILPQMFLTGLRNTLIISVAATVIGVVLGMIIAVMGISTSPWLRIPARIYTDLFRGLPAILTILLIGQGFARASQSIFEHCAPTVPSTASSSKCCCRRWRQWSIWTRPLLKPRCRNKQQNQSTRTK